MKLLHDHVHVPVHIYVHLHDDAIFVELGGVGVYSDVGIY
jgi:hypothetical protein